MAKHPDPESALYRPFVFDSDFGKIGREALKNQEPTPLLFDGPPPDPKLVGEQAYVYERDRLVALARRGEGGYLSEEPWQRIDHALPPGERAAVVEREAQLRALHGGLPDSSPEDAPRATEAGNRIPVRFTAG